MVLPYICDYSILLNVCPHIRAPAAYGRSAGTDPLVLRVATYLSSWLDPLRRLVGMRVEARAGRGSRALLTILRTKKDGRRQTREVSLIRGNWGGTPDADVCCRVLPYADVCCRMLTYAGEC